MEPAGGIEIVDADRPVVRLWGDVDSLLRDQASAALVELLERAGPYVVDVAEVAFIDSSGLAFILQLHRLAGDEGTHVVLRDPPILVMDMLEMLGVTDVPFEFSTGRSPLQGTLRG